MMSKITYEGSKDYVLNVARHKMQMVKPVPMDIGGMDYRMVRGVRRGLGDRCG